MNDQGRSLVEALVASHADPPSRVGDEVGRAGIPADLVWDRYGIVVLVEPLHDDVEELASEGWTVVAADAQQVLAALTGAEGRT